MHGRLTLIRLRGDKWQNGAVVKEGKRDQPLVAVEFNCCLRRKRLNFRSNGLRLKKGR